MISISLPLAVDIDSIRVDGKNNNDNGIIRIVNKDYSVFPKEIPTSLLDKVIMGDLKLRVRGTATAGKTEYLLFYSGKDIVSVFPITLK